MFQRGELNSNTDKSAEITTNSKVLLRLFGLYITKSRATFWKKIMSSVNHVMEKTMPIK